MEQRRLTASEELARLRAAGVEPTPPQPRKRRPRGERGTRAWLKPARAPRAEGNKRGAVRKRHAGNTKRTLGPIVTAGFTPDELRDWMLRTGWSQQQLSVRAAVTRRMLIYYLEGTHKMPRPVRLAMLYATHETPRALRSGAIGRQAEKGRWLQVQR